MMNAREIDSSNWSVGCETMDRDYAVYKHFRPLRKGEDQWKLQTR
jgi:hypothetical protein